MSVQTDIETALITRARGLATALPYPIAVPNKNFNPPVDLSAYIRINHLPNRNERLFLDGSEPHRRMGILQLTVVAPRGQGPEPATQIAGSIADYFPADLVMTSNGVNVKVSKAPDIGTALETDLSWIVPVSVYYESFC